MLSISLKTSAETSEKWTKLPLVNTTSLISLTASEQNWISENHVIRVRVTNYPPFQIIDKNNTPMGISVDYLKLISDRTGIKFEFIPDTRPLKDALEGMLSFQGPDLFQAVMSTPERVNKLLFSNNYFSSPRVIYVPNSSQLIHEIEDINTRTVAVLRDSYVNKQLVKQFPLMNQQLHDSEKLALEAVAFGKADAYIGNLTQSSFLITKHSLSNLKVAAPAPIRNHVFSYACRKDWPELRSIINKGLFSITSAERAKIRNKYVSKVNRQKEKAAILNWLKIIASLASGVIFLFIIWNRLLSREVTKRKLVEEELKASNYHLSLAIDVASIGVWDWDIAKEVGKWNDKMFEIYQIPKQEPIPFGKWAQTVHPNDLKKTVIFFESTIKTKSKGFVEYRIILPDKSIRHIYAAVMPIKDHNSHVVSIFGVNIDISERKQIEEKLEQRVYERTRDLQIEITERKRATSALTKSEEKYRNLVDNSLIGVFNSTIKGELLYGNNALKGMFGFDTTKQMQAGGTLPLWHDLKRREEMLSELYEHGSVNNFESEMVGRTGEQLYVLFSATIHDDVISGMIIDITARKKAEIALLESEKRFRVIFEQTAIGFSHVSPEGQFLRVNQKFCDIIGYEPKEALKLSLEDITSPEDSNTDLNCLQLLITEGRNNFNTEREIIHKNGELIWINLTITLFRDELAQPLFFIGAVEDITARKRMNEALKESNQLFERGFNNANIAINLMSLDGYFIKTNEQMSTMFGYSKQEFKTISMKDLTHPEYQDESLTLVKKMLSGELEKIRLVKRYKHKDGHMIWGEVSSTIVKDSQGRPLYTIAYVMDITEHKQTEQRLQEYQHRLKSLAAQLTLAEEQERRRIAADLHDNVGQSLALTRLQLATARKSLPKDNKQHALFDDISQSLLKTIQDTRHLIFELSSPFLNELGLSSAISEWMEEQITNKHEIKFKLTDNLKNLTLDNDLRAILFRNVRELLINAIKHASAKSISVCIEYKSDQLSITTQDDGIGFDTDLVMLNDGTNKCFGLFSIQERMTDLGGKMEVVSQLGSGSKFVLSLPVQPNKKRLLYE